MHPIFTADLPAEGSADDERREPAEPRQYREDGSPVIEHVLSCCLLSIACVPEAEQASMQFMRPPAARARDAALQQEVEGAAVYNPYSMQSVAKQRRSLPIYQHRNSILYAVETHGVTVVVGETGSGKSTQIPQYLHEAGWTRDGKVVACTQPRRIAAVSLAARVAEEMGCELGQEVGYEIRFDARTHPTHTRVKYMTDGMLLRHLQTDPLLSSYSVIMLDEAHERGMQSDMLLGLLKHVRRKRPDLRLVVSSATVDADKLARFFDESVPVLSEHSAPVTEADDPDAVELPDTDDAIMRQEGDDNIPLLVGHHVHGAALPTAQMTADDVVNHAYTSVEMASAQSNTRVQEDSLKERHGRGRSEDSLGSRSSSRSSSRSRGKSKHRHRHRDRKDKKRKHGRDRSRSSSRSRDRRKKRDSDRSRNRSRVRDADKGADKEGAGSQYDRPDDRVMHERKGRNPSIGGSVSGDTGMSAACAPPPFAPPVTDTVEAETAAAPSRPGLDVKSILQRAFSKRAELAAQTSACAPLHPAQASPLPPAPHSTIAVETVQAPAPPILQQTSAVPGETVKPRKSRWGARVESSIMQPVAPTLSTAAVGAAVDEQSKVREAGLDKACVLAIQGRCFPVEVQYLAEPCRDYVVAAAEAVLDIVRQEKEASSARRNRSAPGDILVFMPGAEDIDVCCDLIRETRGAEQGLGELDVFPLHATLPQAQQLAALEAGRVERDGSAVRKVIVATNIAETSLTIDGIVYVIDSGWMKLPFMDPDSGICALLTVPVSRASAAQRAGRAGRVRPGKCLRLYTEQVYHELPSRTPPEIMRSEVGSILLSMLSLGIRDLHAFPWLDPPLPAQVIRGMNELHALRAIREDGSINGLWGQALADLPVHPRLGACLLSGAAIGCSAAALTMVSMAEVSHQLQLGSHPGMSRSAASALYDASLRAYAAREGDHVTLLNIFTAYTEAGPTNASRHQWAVKHGFSPSALARAVESRAQLQKALSLACSRAREARIGAGLPALGEDEEDYPSIHELLGLNAVEAARMDPRRGLAALLSHTHASWRMDTAVDASNDSQAEMLRKAILCGLFVHVAHRGSDGRYVTLEGGHAASLHPSSIYSRLALQPPEWIMYEEMEWSSSGALLLRVVSPIQPLWLIEVAPHAMQVSSRIDLSGKAAASALQAVTVAASVATSVNVDRREATSASLHAAATGANSGSAATGNADVPFGATFKVGMKHGEAADAPGRLVYKSAAQRKQEAEDAAQGGSKKSSKPVLFPGMLKGAGTEGKGPRLSFMDQE